AAATGYGSSDLRSGGHRELHQSFAVSDAAPVARSQCGARGRKLSRCRSDRRKKHRNPSPSRPRRLAATVDRDMRLPAGLQELLDEAIIDEVVRQLKSGKE